ncbi:hypothetical protein F2Q69_00055024 [Brassica cretica]|uniref:Uncharacterized protein n=1 Tax=Brassica cretica TaxID=69181 RepID=A0A8S9N0W3_BRACR|nr:hypothetical protein F2Q69_00055024 [Brassica cretica]
MRGLRFGYALNAIKVGFWSLSLSLSNPLIYERRIVSIAVALVSTARCPSVARVGDLSLSGGNGVTASCTCSLLSRSKQTRTSGTSLVLVVL